MSRFGIYPVGCDIRNAVVASVIFTDDDLSGDPDPAAVLDDPSQLVKSITTAGMGEFSIVFNDKWKSIIVMCNYGGDGAAGAGIYGVHAYAINPSAGTMRLEMYDDTNALAQPVPPPPPLPPLPFSCLFFLGA